MARNEAYDSTVAARIRLAVHILGDPQLLAAAQGVAIPKSALEKVRDTGKAAHDASTLQNHYVGEMTGAVEATIAQVKVLRRDYRILRVGLGVAKDELGDDPAFVQIVASIDRVLANDTEIRFTTLERDGKKTREAEELQTDEAWRAEVEKDTKDLLGMFDDKRYAPLVQALVEPGINKQFLKNVLAKAQELSGQLGLKAATKGTVHTATKAEHRAVTRQRAIWRVIRPGLDLLAEQYPVIVPLLVEARRGK